MSASVVEPLVFPFGLGTIPSNPGIEILGGKGSSLAEMSRAGFPVPPGFTISTACCAWVDQHGGTWPTGLEDQVRASILQLEETTQRTFGRGPRPLLVAVRSGAAASMPGMMDTILNCGLNPSVAGCFGSDHLFWKEYAEHIRLFAASVAHITLNSDDDITAQERAGRYLAAYEQRSGHPFPTDPWDALKQSIDAVFASWHSDRARAYRQHHDLRGIIGTAVNVQAMFPSQRSGVLFTVDPNKPGSGEMVLEASWGLGEAVVSGAVTPDVYLLDSTTFETRREIVGSRPGHEPALTLDQRREIASLGQRIESHFGVPSDIEWGIADGRVALLQTRKIRGLEMIEETERGRLEETARLKQLAGRDAIVWVVHNLSETLPTPTPLTWDLVRWFMSAQGGYGQLYRLLGHRPQEDAAGEGFLELVAGRIYVDPRRASRFHFGRVPFEYDIDEVLRDRRALDRPPTRFNFDNTDSLFFFRIPSLLYGMIRGARRMKAMSVSPAQRFDTIALPKLERFLSEVQRADLARLSTSELIQELHRRHDFVLGEFAAESLIPGFFAGVAHDRLRHQLIQLFGLEEGAQLSGQLMTGLEGDPTVEQNCQLSEIALATPSVSDLKRQEFLIRYGHRAVNEMELSQPRWREDPHFIDTAIERLRASSGPSPRERHASQAAIRHRAEASLAQRLADVGGSSLQERIDADLQQAQQLLPYREMGKFHLMRGYETIRTLLVELSERWDLGRDLFFLNLDELAHFESDRSSAMLHLTARKLRWRSWQKLTLADVIDSRNLESFGRLSPSTAINSDCYPCRAIASGTARGTARVVLDPNSVADLGRDYILVCPSTDPGWTPLFVNARGLIVERGGALSHGAIVARDFGIPAVAIEGATRLIPDGAQLELDANRGTIVIVPPVGIASGPVETGASR